MDGIPCKFLREESQYHPYGMGSARETWYECAKVDDLPEDEEGECGLECSGYEPMDVACCLIHKYEYLVYNGCVGCEADWYAEISRWKEEE
jgi:hypothetical protein